MAQIAPSRKKRTGLKAAARRGRRPRPRLARPIPMRKAGTSRRKRAHRLSSRTRHRAAHRRRKAARPTLRRLRRADLQGLAPRRRHRRSRQEPTFRPWPAQLARRPACLLRKATRVPGRYDRRADFRALRQVQPPEKLARLRTSVRPQPPRRRDEALSTITPKSTGRNPHPIPRVPRSTYQNSSWRASLPESSASPSSLNTRGATPARRPALASTFQRSSSASQPLDKPTRTQLDCPRLWRTAPNGAPRTPLPCRCRASQSSLRPDPLPPLQPPGAGRGKQSRTPPNQPSPTYPFRVVRRRRRPRVAR